MDESGHPSILTASDNCGSLDPTLEIHRTSQMSMPEPVILFQFVSDLPKY